jgi:hypothetical protein
LSNESYVPSRSESGIELPAQLVIPPSDEEHVSVQTKKTICKSKRTPKGCGKLGRKIIPLDEYKATRQLKID